MGFQKEYEDLDIRREGGFLEVTLRRPAALNALSEELLRSLTQVFIDLRGENIQLVALQGAGGKAFAAGADVRAMEKKDLLEIRSYIELGQNLMKSIEQCHAPVIAFVQGFALGGGLELALACDLIVASDKSRFGQPEVNLGMLPGFGGTQRLLPRVGVGQTKRLILSAEIISAQEAFAIGLLDKIFPEECYAEEKARFVELLLSKAPLALSAAKTVIQQTVSEALAAGLEREEKAFLQLFETNDRREGMQAFFEKRQPKFQGD